jgi:hypothetical protein
MENVHPPNGFGFKTPLPAISDFTKPCPTVTLDGEDYGLNVSSDVTHALLVERRHDQRSAQYDRRMQCCFYHRLD